MYNGMEVHQKRIQALLPEDHDLPVSIVFLYHILTEFDSTLEKCETK